MSIFNKITISLVAIFVVGFAGIDANTNEVDAEKAGLLKKYSGFYVTKGYAENGNNSAVFTLEADGECDVQFVFANINPIESDIFTSNPTNNTLFGDCRWDITNVMKNGVNIDIHGIEYVRDPVPEGEESGVLGLGDACDPACYLFFAPRATINNNFEGSYKERAFLTDLNLNPLATFLSDDPSTPEPEFGITFPESKIFRIPKEDIDAKLESFGVEDSYPQLLP